MVVSTAVAVAAYSTVVAETFAAVGLSTLVPAAFLTTARAIKAAGENAADSLEAASTVPKIIPTGRAAQLIRAVARSSKSIDLLIPKDGTLHAEFAFEASESYKAHMDVGATVQVASIKAEYSALYEASSKNKITLDVDFGLVSYRLKENPSTWRLAKLADETLPAPLLRP